MRSNVEKMSFITSLEYLSMKRNRALRLVSHLNGIFRYNNTTRTWKTSPSIVLRNFRSCSSQAASAQNSQDLEILLPDLTPKELSYVQSQVNVIHSPKCMAPLSDHANLKEEKRTIFQQIFEISQNDEYMLKLTHYIGRKCSKS